MVREIIWSERAKTDRIEILNYWFNRNKSNVYPKKLNDLFKKAVGWIAVKENPVRKTDFENVYVKIVRDYKIFYEIIDERIYILTIFDTRLNPNKLNFRLGFDK